MLQGENHISYNQTWLLCNIIVDVGIKMGHVLLNVGMKIFFLK